MPRLALVILASVTGVAPVLATEPGQPLSYEDWVMDLPGLSVAQVAPFEEQGGPSWCERSDFFCGAFGTSNVGADGSAYYVANGATLTAVCDQIDGGPFCRRLEIRRLTPDGEIEAVAHVDERRSNPDDVIDAANVLGVWVDAVNGFMYVGWDPLCHDDNDGVPDCAYAPGKEVFRIEGLTTTFEVLQTYTPTANNLGFRVPYMPEGFQRADRFDTYWGNLATLGDWSQMQPLRCGYPSEQPNVGDFLTVEDTLPTPQPGSGYYFVTAVTHMGETRYGRRSVGGVLSGREPSVLPACE